MRQLPPWVGQSRGTAIGSLALLDPVEERGGGSFLEKLGDRLVNAVDGGTAAVWGFMSILSQVVALSLIGAIIAPALGAMLVLIAVAWIVVGAVAGYLVHTRADDAPAWARSLVTAMIVVGKITVILLIVASVIIILYLVLAIVVAGRDG
jgi:hypothetical protein